VERIVQSIPSKIFSLEISKIENCEKNRYCSPLHFEMQDSDRFEEASANIGSYMLQGWVGMFPFY
jgi:hypothetical protein